MSRGLMIPPMIPPTLSHIWTKEGDALSWTWCRAMDKGWGEKRGLPRASKKHLDPLTDVQTIPSGEVFLLTDRIWLWSSLTTTRFKSDDRSTTKRLKRTCPQGRMISWNKTVFGCISFYSDTTGERDGKGWGERGEWLAAKGPDRLKPGPLR